MLRSASELRFAHFLWIKDLSLPDTVAHVGSFPFNPLPLVMGISMYYQMKLMPTPTVDSTQQKIFKFMPFFFLLVCYNFSSGLVLYWTMSNLFSILQQILTNKMKDPAEKLQRSELYHAEYHEQHDKYRLMDHVDKKRVTAERHERPDYNRRPAW